MRRKSLIVLASVLVLFSLQSCKSKPEEGLLKNYFHSVTLNDVMTMSTMALEPLSIEAASWKITKVSEEKIEPATLPDLNKAELEAKKTEEGQRASVLDAKDALDAAKDDFDSARTAAAKAAAKKKMDDAQIKFDDAYKANAELKKAYNAAKAAAAREEEITSFSLAAGTLANIRDLKGNVHSKEVEVEVKAKDGSAKNYRFLLRQYDLKDEALNLAHRGSWKIIKMEQI
jgi:hypothetical protein